MSISSYPFKKIGVGLVGAFFILSSLLPGTSLRRALTAPQALAADGGTPQRVGEAAAVAAQKEALKAGNLSDPDYLAAGVLGAARAAYSAVQDAAKQEGLSDAVSKTAGQAAADILGQYKTAELFREVQNGNAKESITRAVAASVAAAQKGESPPPPPPPAVASSSNAASASNEPSFDWLGCSEGFGIGVVTCAVYFVTYIISTIGMLLVAGAAMIVVAALQISIHILDSPAVQTGFGVTLALANLGFVVGIIIIAIATILRLESYGMKKILWKLALMAILINFSFVFAGIILKASDDLAMYFIKQASGTAGGTEGFFKFVNALTSAFQPQTLFIKQNDSGILGRVVDGIIGIVNVPGALVNLQMVILNLMFVIVFSFILGFTMLAVGVMLLIRYVYLGVLLILMPLAWLLWVFPDLKSNWSKWWQHFLRWTLFAPLVIFFLYLAMLVTSGANRAEYLEKSLAEATKIREGPAAAVYILTRAGDDALKNAGNMIIVLALAIGGLFAANALSITGAKAAYGAATGASKAFGKAVAKSPFRLGARAAGGVARQAKRYQEGLGPTQEKGWRRVFNPLNKLAHALGRNINPDRIPILEKMGASKLAQEPGIFKSAYQGLKNGSGLFKKAITAKELAERGVELPKEKSKEDKSKNGGGEDKNKPTPPK